ncbi:MAG TPA: HEPN domain-containing protein [Candidatus Cloacimonadota bacterium]|nr:HEPN domain-containing protein [Candidatus Cloacimonadota bacterium]HQL15482.1 HEPN domain-containing protein [Candidatus Cloacimonadota bacterium]
MGNNNRLEIIKDINERLSSLRQEAIQIDVPKDEIACFYEQRSDLLTDKTNTQILKLDSCLVETVSMKGLKNLLNPMLISILSEHRQFLKEDLDTLIDSLKALPIINYSVFGQISGFNIDKEILELGDFIVYRADSDELRSFIDPINSKISTQCNGFKGLLTNCTTVRINVPSRDVTMAIIKAYKYFRSFDFVTAFVINDISSNYNYGIFTYKPPSLNTCIAIGENKSWELNSNVVNSPITLVISEHEGQQLETFSDIWLLITKINKNKIESRILNSIEWIGKAIFEPDISKAFVMYMFSIESLLQYDEDTMINPSIIHQLSESLAFLLGIKYKDRINIVNCVKALYRKRSAIVHGGDTRIGQNDIIQINKIAISAVWAFLSNPELKELKNMSDFNTWLSIKKFTEPSLIEEETN